MLTQTPALLHAPAVQIAVAMEMHGTDLEAFASSAAQGILSEHALRGLPKRALRKRATWERVRRELLPEVAAWAAAAAERQRAEVSPLLNDASWRLVWMDLDPRRPCANLGCTNVRGASDARLANCARRCSGCGMVAFCSTACRDAAWPEHSAVCGRQAAWLRAVAKEGPGALLPQAAGARLPVPPAAP